MALWKTKKLVDLSWRWKIFRTIPIQPDYKGNEASESMGSNDSDVDVVVEEYYASSNQRLLFNGFFVNEEQDSDSEIEHCATSNQRLLFNGLLVNEM